MSAELKQWNRTPPWALFQYPIRRLIVRYRKVSKPRDLYLGLSDRSEIWQAPRQHWCRCACQISKRCDDLNYQSRGFETSRDLTIRRLIRYWNGRFKHHSDVTWAPLRLKTTATQLSIQQLFEVDNKENSNTPHNWSFVTGIYWSETRRFYWERKSKSESAFMQGLRIIITQQKIKTWNDTMWPNEMMIRQYSEQDSPALVLYQVPILRYINIWFICENCLILKFIPGLCVIRPQCFKNQCRAIVFMIYRDNCTSWYNYYSSRIHNRQQ